MFILGMSSKMDDRHFRKVTRADRNSRRVITLAGYGIIISILAILLYLIFQSLPLSFGAKLTLRDLFSWGSGVRDRTMLIGIDQYQEVVYKLDENGRVYFSRLSDQKGIRTDSIGLQNNEKVLCASKGRLGEEIIAIGTNLGKIITAEIKMEPFFENDKRRIKSSTSILDSWQAESDSADIPAHIEKLVFRRNEDLSEFWAWVNHKQELHLRIYDADDEEYYEHNLTSKINESPITQLAMSYNGENLIIGKESGELDWFDVSDFETIKLKDQWKAYNVPISTIGYIIGDEALVIGSTNGDVQVWFPIRTPANLFKFTKTHEFKPHNKAVTQVYPSPRNRDFLTIDAEGSAHLNFSTTSKTQLEFKAAQSPVQTAAFSPKANGIVVIDNQDRMGHYFLENLHPETTLKTLFGKVHYEGYAKPEFVWQSTGGTDEFEPKLSLIPLIFGTLKGTLYAMIFSIPLAILGAIYISQFTPYRFSRIIKPTIEIMAAFPSVVIGFLAGLYFSTLFEANLIGIILFMVFLPVVLILGILIWRIVPEKKRMEMPAGWELLFAIPVILIAFGIASLLAHPVEATLFAGNIKQWLFDNLNIVYDTRNSFVVGFALGFAVIPIIFTVSEDALSNVPKSLTSASLALGASRWQTVRKVVLPAASGGIFAAIMLGFGRAVGETMIVLMATGNTPILDLSPFNGFRAMSACIAVEIPEAPVGGTLYRVLFLTALLLFVFTFVINSLSAIIGDRLRKKYARF